MYRRLPVLAILAVLAALLLAPGMLRASELTLSRAVGTLGSTATVDLEASGLPAGFTRLALEFEGPATITAFASHPDAPAGTWLDIDEQPDGIVYTIHYAGDEAFTTGSVTLASVTLRMPWRLMQGGSQILRVVEARQADGSDFGVTATPGRVSTHLVTEPVSLFTFLAFIVAGIYWLSSLAPLRTFFRYAPPLIWMYFIPMIMTTVGVTPDTSPLYSPFMSRVMLPAVLVLLLIGADVRSVVQLGPKAIAVMLVATLGIVVGAIVSTGVFAWLAPGALPEDTWKAVAALAGSWIGGSPNMTAVIETLGTPPSLIGPMIVVDTVLAYSWLGLLIAMSAYQRQIDAYHKADARVLDEISSRLQAEQEASARAPRVADIAYMGAIAFVVSQACLFFGAPLDVFFKDVLGLTFLSGIINAFGWGILLITAVGLFLSTTRVRDLEYCGASSIGYVGLYLLLTTYGARANLTAILEVPVFFALGALWLAIHIAILYAGLRLLRAPLFLGATSSMANIGGTASAPVVAAAYHPSMAPVGLLMAILGGTLGTPVALFLVATATRVVSGG